MFVLLRTKRMQLHINDQPSRRTVKRSKRLKGYAIVGVRGGQNGHFPALELGIKNQKFPENLKSAT